MKILSVNVGLAREVTWQGKRVTTGIFKEPVQGRVMMRRLNLDGDQQADLTVHGGVNKAVYLYPSEHYSYWRSELPGMDLPWGMFGDADIIKRFLASRRTGFYVAVMREGMVGAGDAVELVGHEQQDISAADITRLYAFDKDDVKSLGQATQIKALPESWKGYFRHQLEKQTEQ